MNNLMSKLAAVFILSFIAVTSVSAEEKNKPEIIAALNDLLKPMASFSARFEQVITDNTGSELQRITGLMHVMRPGRFVWISDEPFPQKIVSNGSTLWIYDNDLEQVTVQALDDKVANTPALLLSGDPEKIDENFHLKQMQENNQKQRFELKPKGSDTLFEKMSVVFEANKLLDMDLHDGLGNKTAISFSKVKQNPKFDKSLFEFVIPEGVDIISDLP